MKLYIVLAAFSFGLAACSPAADTTEKFQISASSVVDDPTLTPAQKADALSLQAETLLSAYGLQESYDMADSALKQDSTNFRAGFIKAIVTPALLQMGIFSRGHGLASKNAKTLSDYNNYVALQKNKLPESALKDFLFKQATEFKSEAEVQDHLDLLADSLVQLIEYLKAHRYEELSMKANPIISPDIAKNYAAACRITTTSALEYQLVCPPKEAFSTIKLNRADFEAIRNLASAGIIYIAAWTSYDLSGLTDGLKEKSKMTEDSFDPESFINRLFTNSSFGLLRSKALLGKLKPIALDLSMGIQSVRGQQYSLCPQGTDAAINRPGYLFNAGLCINSATYASYDSTVMILIGYKNSLTVQKNGTAQGFGIDYASTLYRPMQDLRKLGPLKFDKCHQLESMGDSTAGGFFINGDTNLFLKAQNADCTR